jgi:hypothetical protein
VAVNPTMRLAKTRETLERMTPPNAFERALLLESLLLTGGGADGEAETLLERLAAEQLSDGSWPSAPILRLANRTCWEPWTQQNAGRLYADPRRLFTSATVLRAMCRWLTTSSARGRRAT